MKIKNLIKPDQNLEAISNKDLYHLCQEYGRGIKALRRTFSVLMAEVFRRNLHKKYGFESIHEFAAKIGGMNKELVDRILWLVKILEDKPCLWQTFRTEGWSKVRIVANLATPETDKFWAEKVGLLSKPALEIYAKWYRETYLKKDDVGETTKLTRLQTNIIDDVPKNATQTQTLTLFEPKTSLVQNFGDVITDRPAGKQNFEQDNVLVKIRFNTSEETEFKFRLFKQRFSKKNKMAMTSGETFTKIIRIAEKAIEADREWQRFLHL